MDFSWLLMWDSWRQAPPPRLGSALLPELSRHASSFVSQCEDREARMRRVVAELHSVAAAVRDSQRNLQTRLVQGLGAAAFLWLLAVLAADETRGWSVALFGAAAVVGIVSALALLLSGKVKEWRLQRRAQGLWVRFRETMKPLEASLEALKATCGKLRSTPTRDLKFIRLEIDILEIFFVISKAAAAAAQGAVSEAAWESGRSLDQFLRMKIELETFLILPGSEPPDRRRSGTSLL